ncbi:MAG: NADH-quinone oxidoreductase subunit B [candidate division Zixibacteria bacterium]|nr:NADH-quinone oxidoreductase subunit B [candidate division Zixibacteria bacterium]
MGGSLRQPGLVRADRDGYLYRHFSLRTCLCLEEGSIEVGVVSKVPVFMEKMPGGTILLTQLDKVMNWSRASSLWYLLFGTACCAIEMMCTGASRYDFDRLGMIFRASPRQADLMFVAGTITHKMAPRVKVLYEQMSEPRYVLAMGGCAIRGGPFYYDTYSVLKGIDKVIPVDVYVPGCPPRPESLMEGCIKLMDKIKQEKLSDWSSDLGKQPDSK